jgi:hypothetical protein
MKRKLIKVSIEHLDNKKLIIIHHRKNVYEIEYKEGDTIAKELGKIGFNKRNIESISEKISKAIIENIEFLNITLK